MPRIHVTLSGQRIEYPDPKGALGKFLARLERMVDDPDVTVDAMTALAYSPDNPILDPAFFPERGPVLKDTLTDPHYSVMNDLLWRKRVAEKGIDLEKIAARYTIPASEAAQMLDVEVSTVMKAIHSRRLHAWVRDHRYWLTPESVKDYEVGNQGGRATRGMRPRMSGPAAEAPATPGVRRAAAPKVRGAQATGGALEMCFGHRKAQSFRLKHPGSLVEKTRLRANIQTGRLLEWTRMAVITGRDLPDGEYDYQMFVLTPSAQPNAVLFDPFYVRGTFDVSEVRTGRQAYEGFRTFVPE